MCDQLGWRCHVGVHRPTLFRPAPSEKQEISPSVSTPTGTVIPMPPVPLFDKCARKLMVVVDRVPVLEPSCLLPLLCARQTVSTTRSRRMWTETTALLCRANHFQLDQLLFSGGSPGRASAEPRGLRCVQWPLTKHASCPCSSFAKDATRQEQCRFSSWICCRN